MLYSCLLPAASDAVSLINRDLSSINTWSLSNGLLINPAKSKVLLIASPTLLRNITQSNFLINYPITLNNVSIPFCDSAKMLGFFIDSKLSWEVHINIVIQRINMALRSLYSSNLYLNLNIKFKIAHALIMPIMNYGIEVFSGCSSTLINKLKVAFNNVVRFVFSLKRSEHVSSFAQSFLKTSFYDFLNNRCLFFLYKILFFKIPSYLYNRFSFSISSRSSVLIIPAHSSSYMSNSFQIRSARLWNALPRNMRMISISPFTFKKNLLSL